MPGEEVPRLQNAGHDTHRHHDGPPGRLCAVVGVIRALPGGWIGPLITRTLPPGDWWWEATILGPRTSAHFPLLFVSAYLLPGGVAAVFSAMHPLFVAALA